jgi:signal transduction histidine kinase
MEFLKENPWVIVSFVLFIVVVFQLFRKAGKQKPEAPKAAETDAETASFNNVSELIEQERNRIASELHDELGTLLSVIHLDLELVLRESSQLTPYGEARLLEIRKNLNLVIESIRHNIWSLAPQMLDQVQIDFALRELCRKLDAYKGTHLHFVQSGIAFPITHKQKLNLFRIVQELLTNAIKHSGAWNISVQLHWDDDTLTIVVEDDGSGYSRPDEKPSSSGGGMGTGNIIKRANIIGATMLREELTRGMRVTLSLKKTGAEAGAPMTS